MKKLLSIIVTVAMLVSCMVPALSVSAADAKVAGLEVAVENVTFDPNSRDDVLTAKATVSIVNNPGFAEAVWYLYATNTEMKITEVKDVQDLADGENGMSIEVAKDKSTTLGNAVKNAFAAAGVATGSTVKTAVVSMITADGESDVTYTGDFLEVTFEIAKDKADIVEGDAFTFGLIPGVDGVCYNVEGDEVVFAPLTGTVTAYTDPNAPEYADKKFDNFTFFVDDVVVKPGVDTVTVGFGFDGTNADFEKYGLLSVEIGFVYPESFKIIDCYKGTAMDPAATEIAVQELTEGGNYHVATAPARLQEIFASSGYNAEGKTDKYVYQVHFSTAEDLPSYEGGYINYFVLDVSDAEPGTYELPIITEGTVMGYDATADYKYPQWTADYDLDAGHVTVTAEETECTHETVTTTTVDATCTADGSVTIICDDCGETIYTEVLKSEGHKAGDKVTEVEPTYDAEGKWVINCKVCGEELESGSIPALVPAANATVSLKGAVVTHGEQAKLDLVIDGSDYFIAIVDVHYDAAELSFVEFANTLDAYVFVTETGHGAVRLYIEAKADADLAAGVQGSLVFDIADDDYGTYPVNIDVVDLVSYDAGDIENVASGATVKVVMPGNIVVGDVEAEYDSTVKVPVSVENSTGIWAGRVEIAYDATALEFVGIENGLFAFVEGENYSVNDGVITLFFEAADMNDVVADGVLFAVEFKTLDKIGDTAVTINVVDLINVAGDDLGYSAVDGFVAVTACKHASTTTEKVDATVDNAGYIKEICDKCGETVSEETIPALTAVYVETETVEEWDTTWAYVCIKNNPGIWATRLQITLDEGLAFDDITGYLCDTVEGVNYSVDGNVITVFLEADDMVNNEYDSTIVAVLVSAAEVGTYGISVDVLDLINVDGEDIDAVVIDGTVTFVECTHSGETYEEVVDATVDAEGSITTYCNNCYEAISTVVIPKISTIYVDADSVEVFEKAVAEIKIKNNPGIWATRLEITVGDAANFEVVSGDMFELVEGENYSINGNVITVFLDAADMANVEGDGTIVAIEFYSETECTVDVDVEVLDLVNVDGKDVAFVAEDGTVEFTACTHAETYEERVDATLEEDGYINTICKKCDEVLNTVVIPRAASIVVSTETAECWDNGCVSVNIKNNPGIWAARFEITFTEGADFIGLYGTDFALEEGVNYSVNGNVITVFIENDEMVNFDGEFLFDVYFYGNNVAGSEVEVSIEVLDLITVDGKDVESVVTNGKLTFTECTHSGETYEERVEATYDAEGYVKTICSDCDTVLETVVLPKLAAVELVPATYVDAYTGHTVAVRVKNNPGIWALRLEVAFDDNAFDVAFVNSYAFNFDESNYSVKDGVITIFVEYDAAEDYKLDEVLFDITFSPKDTVAVGAYPVTLTVVEAINYAGEDVELGAISTELVIAEHTVHRADEPVVENEVEADCENDGSYDTVTYCCYCGVEISRETTVVPALGHKAGEAVIENEVAADCENDGSYDTVVYCTVCGEEVSRETTLVPALGHKAGEAVIENDVTADCENDGSYDTVVYCTVCGEELSRETTVVPAFGHEAGEWEIVKKPTATETGLKVQYCIVCGEVVAEEIIPVFESNGILGFFAESVVLDGDRIDVVAKKDAIEVDFALELPEGATVEVPEEVYVAFDGNQYWYRSYPGLDSYELVVTFADGTVINYTVYVHFSFSAYVPEIIPGWSASDVQVNGDVIDVTVLKDVTEVDFALDLPAGATAEAFGNVSAIFDGNDTWYRVYNGTESFTLVVTLADGTDYTFTVNANFDVETYEAVVTPGWSADSAVVNGNVIDVVVKENIQEVDFALNIPEGATVTVTDGVECIFDGHDTWYRVYFGAGLDTFEITVTLANGTVYTYTVNVTFNVEKFDAEVMGGWSASNVAINGNTITVDVIAGVDVVDFAITNLPEGATATVSDNATVVFDGHDYWYGVARDAGNFTVTVTLASGVNYVYTVIANFN